MTPPQPAGAHFAREHFHPLEIIPFFRRFRRTVARDLAYTFIWSCLFGLFFCALGAFTGGRFPSLQALGIYLLISNFIGYSIHLLFSLGQAVGLDVACRRAGFAAKVFYFSAVPLVGVLLGMWLASFVVDVGLRSLFRDPGAILALEDVTEASYRIDRMLSALRLVGTWPGSPAWRSVASPNVRPECTACQSRACSSASWGRSAYRS